MKMEHGFMVRRQVWQQPPDVISMDQLACDRGPSYRHPGPCMIPWPIKHRTEAATGP